MKKQVVVIHGGKTFKTYQEYIYSLLNREVDADRFKEQKNWRDSLGAKLGADFEVFTPKMPNPNNAVYKEWKIWFERMTEFLNDNVIFVGHSLGGIFLAKYFSENLFNKKVKAVLLVAAPSADLKDEAPLFGFTLPKSLKKLQNQAKIIYLIHSKDDPIVPFSHVNKYKKLLPNSQIVAFKNKQHFHRESFPEIVKLIKKLT